MRLQVHVLPPHAGPTQPATCSFLEIASPSLTLEELSLSIAKRHQRLYPHRPNLYIHKLQDADCNDLDLSYCVSDVFTDKSDNKRDSVVRVIQGSALRESSIPPESALKSGRWAAKRHVPRLGAIDEASSVERSFSDRSSKRARLEEAIVEDSEQENDRSSGRPWEQRNGNGHYYGEEGDDESVSGGAEEGEAVGPALRRMFSPELGERVAVSPLPHVQTPRSADLEITKTARVPLERRNDFAQVKEEVPSSSPNNGQMLVPNAQPPVQHSPQQRVIRRSDSVAESEHRSPPTRSSVAARRRTSRSDSSRHSITRAPPPQRDIFDYPASESEVDPPPAIPARRNKPRKTPLTNGYAKANDTAVDSPSQQLASEASASPDHPREQEERHRVEQEVLLAQQQAIAEQEERERRNEEEARDARERAAKAAEVRRKAEEERRQKAEEEAFAKKKAEEEHQQRRAEEERLAKEKEEQERQQKIREEEERAEQIEEKERVLRDQEDNEKRLAEEQRLAKEKATEEARVARQTKNAEQKAKQMEEREAKRKAEAEKKAANAAAAKEQKRIEKEKADEEKKRAAEEKKRQQQEKKAEIERKRKEAKEQKAAELAEKKRQAAEKKKATGEKQATSKGTTSTEQSPNAGPAEEHSLGSGSSQPAGPQPTQTAGKRRRSSADHSTSSPEVTKKSRTQEPSPTATDSPVAEDSGEDMAPPPVVPNSALRRSNLKLRDQAPTPMSSRKAVSFSEQAHPPVQPVTSSQVSMVSTPTPAVQKRSIVRTPITIDDLKAASPSSSAASPKSVAPETSEKVASESDHDSQSASESGSDSEEDGEPRLPMSKAAASKAAPAKVKPVPAKTATAKAVAAKATAQSSKSPPNESPPNKVTMDSVSINIPRTNRQTRTAAKPIPPPKPAKPAPAEDESDTGASGSESSESDVEMDDAPPSAQPPPKAAPAILKPKSTGVTAEPTAAAVKPKPQPSGGKRPPPPKPDSDSGSGSESDRNNEREQAESESEASVQKAISNMNRTLDARTAKVTTPAKKKVAAVPASAPPKPAAAPAPAPVRTAAQRRSIHNLVNEPVPPVLDAHQISSQPTKKPASQPEKPTEGGSESESGSGSESESGSGSDSDSDEQDALAGKKKAAKKKSTWSWVGRPSSPEELSSCGIA